MTHLVWVIGARGLLGSAIKAEASRRGDWASFPAQTLTWGSPAAIARQITESFTELLTETAARSATWSIIWAAGASVTGATDEDVDAELRDLASALDAAAALLGAGASPGSFFYASSAGAVYAGSAPAPFTEYSTPEPVSPYGRGKLDGEELVRGFGRATGTRTLIGRIANLYGPGQSVDKQQGLISALARTRFGPDPISIYVPLDTVRDYIYVDDCAARIMDCLERLVDDEHSMVTKILCSGQTVTISSLVAQLKSITKGYPRLALSSSPLASRQALDMRLQSVVWPDLDKRPLVPLGVGFHRVILDALRTTAGP